MTPVPKPTKRPPKPRKQLRAKRWGVSKSKRGTAHSRRPREFGRMMYYSTLRCDVATAMEEAFRTTIGCRARSTIGPCHGRVEVMHLRDTASQHRAKDHLTAPGCVRHHHDIDGDLGGRAPWYVALGREGQRALREQLIARADLKWSTLTGAQRADWEARAMERDGL
jgi:hypothetical protein